MKVLISGYYGFHNMGDEAILKSIISALKKEKDDIEITVLSDDVKNTEIIYGVKSINRWNLVDIYKELLKSDGLISGGGSLFQDVTSSRSILYYSSIILLAKLASKPVFIYAQGVGPLNRSVNRDIVKRVFNKADCITLRDKESKELIQSIGVNKEIKIVPDPVMGFEMNNKLNYDIKEKNDYITVSIRQWKNSSQDFISDMAKFSDNIVKSGINVVFVPMHGEKDETISKEIVSKMNQNARVLSSDLTMEEKIMYIKNSKLMIGMRLHALILAANVSTPMIGISYDPKIDSYLSLVDQPSIGSVDEGLDINKLSNMALEKVKNYEFEKIQLKKHAYVLKQSATQTANMAIQLLQRYK